VKRPDVHYARSGDVAIAYQVLGDGPHDVVWFRGMAGDLLSTWDQPLLARHAAGLADVARVLMLDKRGTGLSDRVREVPTLETRMDDIRAVMDAAGSERAILWSGHEGSRSAILFAGTYPERTAGLVLLEPSVRGTRTPDYPWAPSAEEWRRRLAEIRAGWGRRDFFERLVRDWAPTVADDEGFRNWFVEHMRRSLSPGAALSFFRTMMEADVTDVLPAIRVPTLIVCKRSEREESEYVAARIAGAQVAELPAFRGIFTWVDDEPHEATMRETRRFLESVGRPAEPERVLATVLFTDIVGSTERAAELGDRAWRDVLARHHDVVRDEIARRRGTEIDTAGDGVFATFDGPARAIGCACAVRRRVRDLDLEIRAGVHTAEFELDGGKPRGIAVHIGARIAHEAAAGEVLVSSTVKDLVAGSDIEFDDRGVRRLKGVPGEWRVYAVAAVG
jgi:class 3 adenylate cyclase/alpha-beta hydrolase superfamily lysophospholipase